MTTPNFKNELNQQQYEVVTGGDGPHLVLAGAGSGKTRALVYRVAWLVSQGIKPEKILLLTFTNKAANEMMTRSKALLGVAPKEKFSLWGGTFHSVANRLLRIYGKHIGLESSFTIMDTNDVDTLLKLISKEFLKGLSEKRKPSPAIFRETISFANNSKINIEASLEIKFPEWVPFVEVFEKIATEYQRRKQVANLLDFDDLLLYWKKLTQDARAGEMLAKKWDYILVDEYQDTNVIQAEIIFNLSKQHQNILVVGDDAQSIYSFRAANIQNILDFPKHFKKCKTHKLETNYRSTPEILDLANQVIAVNQNQFTKELTAINDSHVRPELVALRSNKEEAWFVADKIQQLLGRDIRPSSIAILFRAAHYSQTLEMELNRRGIDYEMRGGLRFFERAHVKDVLAWLKVLGNHRDEVSWMRILQIYEGIGPVTAQLIYQQIVSLKDLSELVELKLKLAAKAGQSWSRIGSLLDKIVKQRDKDISLLINIIIEQYSGYLIEKYPDYRQRQDDLDQLAIFAVDYDSLEEFLNEISLQEGYSASQAKKENKESVILSTVHQAKGLEWAAVFVINMTDSAFPHPFAEEVEEERRLFYVAITRACRYLYLTYPLAVYRFDGFKSMSPSPFISEVEGNLLNHNQLSKTVTHASGDGVKYVTDLDCQDNDGEGFLPSVNNW
jgi:DNA helicase II / ATP-dependent DNA helicase PcrA